MSEVQEAAEQVPGSISWDAVIGVIGEQPTAKDRDPLADAVKGKLGLPKDSKLGTVRARTSGKRCRLTPSSPSPPRCSG